MSTYTIDVAKDFSPYPFGSHREQSDRSGEVFRDVHLIPALEKYDHVVVDLSGTNYYGSSFLEEAFGGLLRKGFDTEQLIEKLEVRHEKLSSVVQEIDVYIGKEEDELLC